MFKGMAAGQNSLAPHLLNRVISHPARIRTLAACYSARSGMAIGSTFFNQIQSIRAI